MGATPETDDERAFRLRAAERAHAAHAKAVASAFAPLVAMGHDILKAVAFLNGGAAIATIGLMAAALSENPSLARWLVAPVAAFGFGLTVAACATGWSYLAQGRHAAALAAREPVWRAPFLQDTDASAEAARAGDRFQSLAMAATLVSIGSAILGFSAAGIILLATLP